MQKLVIITSYYPPEIGAASNRIYHLAEGLKTDYEVTVITPLPNYPTGKIFSEFKGKFISRSKQDGINVTRLWLYASKSKNKFLRLFAMLSYSMSLSWFLLWYKIPNKVIIQSPPLLVSFTCMFLLRSKKRKLILNVSDLWPSAGFELGTLNKNFSYRLLQKLEAFNYNNADLILGQSNEILAHIKTITTKPKFFLYRNFPNIKIPSIRLNEDKDNSKLKIVYAGLLGVAQGILKLCKNLEYGNIELHIYGSGAEEEDIVSFIETHKELPIFFYGRLKRTQLHVELQKYDVAIIPLLNRVYGSVPSKIFEYAKLGLPILYFGGGEGEVIIDNYKLGWVAEVGDYDNLNSVIKLITSTNFDFQTKIAIQNSAYIAFDFNKQLDNLKEIF